MKLATRKNSTRDGELLVVSRDNQFAVCVGSSVPTMQALLDDWSRKAPELEAIYESLNAGDRSDAFPVDESKFDPEYIDSELAPERREALTDGAKPTPEEVKRWKEKKESLVFQEDGSWFHFYIWRVDLAEETLYFRSLHGDGGILDDFDGPFLTQEEALAGAANVDISP